MTKRPKKVADEGWGRSVLDNFKENEWMFWKEMNSVRKGKKHIFRFIRDKQGELVKVEKR